MSTIGVMSIAIPILGLLTLATSSLLLALEQLDHIVGCLVHLVVEAVHTVREDVVGNDPGDPDKQAHRTG